MAIYLPYIENTIAAVSTVSTKTPQWEHAFDIPSPKFSVTALKWLEKITYEDSDEDEDDENNFFFRQTRKDSSGLILAGTGLQVFELWPKESTKSHNNSNATNNNNNSSNDNNDDSNKSGETGPLMRFTCDLPRPIKSVACSPDGRFIATTGRTDTLVKIWFRRPQMPQCHLLDGTPHPKCVRPDPDSLLWVTFSVLRHPGTVISLSWLPARRGRCKQNVLMTNAVDNTVRLWAERIMAEDSISSPVPSRDYPRFFLCGEVPASPGSLVEWVKPFYTYKVQEKDPDGEDEDDDEDEGDEEGEEYESDGGYRSVSDSDDEEKKKKKGKKKKDNWNYGGNQRKSFDKKRPIGPLSHSPVECPLIENNIPKTQKRLKGTTVEWIMELNNEGTLSVWKFTNDPFQTPRISLWSQTVNTINSLNSFLHNGIYLFTET